MLQAVRAMPRPFLATAALAALVSAGCTMCPDPYDYAGPVPNGSAPQNDFRARSNGILPLGAAGQPFPQVVKAVPQPVPDDESAPAEPPQMAAADDDDDVLQLSGEEPLENTAQEPPADAEPPTAAVEPAVAADAAETSLHETPGWRARR